MIIFPLARRDPTVQVADPARDPLRTAWTPASALPIWEQIERSGNRSLDSDEEKSHWARTQDVSKMDILRPSWKHLGNILRPSWKNADFPSVF